MRVRGQYDIGRTDNCKDGGILASNWGLHRAPYVLAKVAEEAGVELRFFHDRGGTVSRGAGPTGHGVPREPDAFFHATSTFEFDLKKGMSNIETMKNQSANIRVKIELAVDKLARSLPPDDTYYLRFLLGNDFVDRAVVHLFQFIEKSNTYISSSLGPTLAELKIHRDKLKAAEEELLAVRLSTEEIVECAHDFFRKYEMEATVFPETITYSTVCLEQKNTPNWSIIARLNPPTSQAEREVQLIITAASKEVDLMIRNA